MDSGGRHDAENDWSDEWKQPQKKEEECYDTFMTWSTGGFP